MRKLWELLHLDDKCMTIIGNILNGSLFQDIYVFSLFDRFPSFSVLEYEK